MDWLWKARFRLEFQEPTSELFGSPGTWHQRFRGISSSRTGLHLAHLQHAWQMLKSIREWDIALLAVFRAGERLRALRMTDGFSLNRRSQSIVLKGSLDYCMDTSSLAQWGVLGKIEGTWRTIVACPAYPGDDSPKQKWAWLQKTGWLVETTTQGLPLTFTVYIHCADIMSTLENWVPCQDLLPLNSLRNFVIQSESDSPLFWIVLDLSMHNSVSVTTVQLALGKFDGNCYAKSTVQCVDLFCTREINGGNDQSGILQSFPWDCVDFSIFDAKGNHVLGRSCSEIWVVSDQRFVIHFFDELLSPDESSKLQFVSLGGTTYRIHLDLTPACWQVCMKNVWSV